MRSISEALLEPEDDVYDDRQNDADNEHRGEGDEDRNAVALERYVTGEAPEKPEPGETQKEQAGHNGHRANKHQPAANRLQFHAFILPPANRARRNATPAGRCGNAQEQVML